LEKYFLSWEEAIERVALVDSADEVVYGIPRGGMCLAILFKKARITHDPLEATMVIDDILTTGQTRNKWLKKYPHVKFWAMINQKPNENHKRTIIQSIHENDAKLPWVILPWEQDKDETVDQHLTRIHELCVTQQNFVDSRYKEYKLNMQQTLQQYREKYKYF